MVFQQNAENLFQRAAMEAGGGDFVFPLLFSEMTVQPLRPAARKGWKYRRKAGHISCFERPGPICIFAAKNRVNRV